MQTPCCTAKSEPTPRLERRCQASEFYERSSLCTARRVAWTLFISRTSPTFRNGFSSIGAAAGSPRLRAAGRAELERRVVIEALAPCVVERHQQPGDAAERGVHVPAQLLVASRQRHAAVGVVSPESRAPSVALASVVEGPTKVDLAGGGLLIAAQPRRRISVSGAV